MVSHHLYSSPLSSAFILMMLMNEFFSLNFLKISYLSFFLTFNFDLCWYDLVMLSFVCQVEVEAKKPNVTILGNTLELDVLSLYLQFVDGTLYFFLPLRTHFSQSSLTFNCFQSFSSPLSNCVKILSCCLSSNGLS
jgi:hypothetical protein